MGCLSHVFRLAFKFTTTILPKDILCSQCKLESAISSPPFWQGIRKALVRPWPQSWSLGQSSLSASAQTLDPALDFRTVIKKPQKLAKQTCKILALQVGSAGTSI